MLDFCHFFVILLSWLRNFVQSQQQKNKIKFGSLLRGGVVGGSVGASSFGWFLGGFGWFLWVEDNSGWFQVVCCFSSYTNCTAYRRVNSLLHSWSHVIDWDHSIFLFKVKQQEKYYCCLVALQSENKWLLPILYCVLCQKKASFKEIFWIHSNKTQRKSE